MIVLLFVSSLFMCLTFQGFGQTAISPELSKLLGVPPRDWNMAALTEAERQNMIAELRRAKSNSEFYIAYRPRPELLLIELGDREALSKYITENFLTYGTKSIRASRDLVELRQPLLIPKFADDLFLDEKAELVQYGEDILGHPQSFNAAKIIHRIVLNSPAFSAETKRWMGSIPEKPLVEKREALRAFWRENAAHFTAEEYSKVQPPSSSIRKPLVPSNSMPRTTSSNVISPANVRPSAVAIPAISFSSTSAAPPIPEAKPMEPASTPSVRTWPWLVGIAAILGFLLWRRAQ